eukprot:9001867-Pyramimonas_sp.AAC.1
MVRPLEARVPWGHDAPMRDVDLGGPVAFSEYLSGVSHDDCVAIFAQYVVGLKRERVPSAKQACVLSYWAHGAGVGGLTDQVAFAPGKQSGHYSRHWGAALKEAEGDERYLK